MTKLLLLVSLSVLLPGQTYGQEPPIGIIDFYGLHSLSERQARQALQIKEGDPVPTSHKEAERRLEALPNVRQASIANVCCEAGKALLYVGIREKGAPSLQFRPAPQGSIRLPETMLRAGDAFGDALEEGLLKGDAGEDDSQGHALNSYPKLRAAQEQFIVFAAQDFKLLRAVLRESADARHRALAAQIIAYTANKRDVVQDLVYGMSDPDGDVRNSSLRALAVLADFAQRSPERRIEVPVEPFIDLLNSIVWTDRNKSSMALLHLTEKRDPAILSKLRERALPSLVEMSRWKSRGHASSPFFLLGRAGNLPEAEILKYWQSDNREGLIEEVLRRVKSK
ncbi:MAG: hypothetical protein JOZ02_11410 [Acidobacteria bacterium]|nr:hypothetical protein [Acidobacteriota bacterium]